MPADFAGVMPENTYTQNNDGNNKYKDFIYTRQENDDIP
jgi:hypothetical protein